MRKRRRKAVTASRGLPTTACPQPTCLHVRVGLHHREATILEESMRLQCSITMGLLVSTTVVQSSEPNQRGSIHPVVGCLHGDQCVAWKGPRQGYV